MDIKRAGSQHSTKGTVADWMVWERLPQPENYRADWRLPFVCPVCPRKVKS